MPAVDILMPDGTWITNRYLPQDVANHLGLGADMWNTQRTIRYPLISHGSMYDPAKIGVMVAGVEVPLINFLTDSSGTTTPSAATTPTVQPPAPPTNGNVDANILPQTIVTTSGGMMPAPRWEVSLETPARGIYRLILLMPEGDRYGTSGTYPSCSRMNPDGCRGMEFPTIDDAVAYAKANNEKPVLIDLPFDPGVEEAWRIVEGGEPNPPNSRFLDGSAASLASSLLIALPFLGMLFRRKRQ